MIQIKKKIENLKKKYNLGNLKFDSVIIADFDESLKSVITSLLYTDVSPKEKYIITLNQIISKSSFPFGLFEIKPSTLP